MEQLKLKNYYVASLSGGKDSLFMFAHIIANSDKYPLDAVVHFSLGELDYPWVNEVMDYVRMKCKMLNIAYFEYKPRDNFIDLYKKWGYPSRTNRWCNKNLKMDCERQLQEVFKGKKNIITYVGLCADEEYRQKDNPNIIYPLSELGIFEETIWRWAKNQPMFHDFYKYNYRQGCILCPLQDMQNTKYNSMYYPCEYNAYMTLAEIKEKEYFNKSGKRLSVWQGNPKYDTAYRRNRISKMELKELTEWRPHRKSKTRMEMTHGK